MVSVNVRDNNVDQALRVLKKKMQREGIFREMKLRRHYEKPSEKKHAKTPKQFVVAVRWNVNVAIVTVSRDITLNRILKTAAQKCPAVFFYG